MHIPDGWVSPTTAATMYAAALPFWYIAGRRLQRALTQRMVPLLSLFAALSFAIMMFNIPLPGGTTGHITGGAIIAAVLGPWPAVLAMSVVLVIQALFFGDGGIMAIGANCFNMAIALPLASYVVFRIIAARSGATSNRRAWAAAIGGYVGVCLAALLTAVELGVQPLLFNDGGLPLYSPYDLSQTLPAMLLPHLLLIGPLEGLVTGLAVRYLQRSHFSLFSMGTNEEESVPTTPGGSWVRSRRLWAAIAILVVLSPLGMLAPGSAWGEWAPAELREMLGFVPSGLERFSCLNPFTILPDYSLPGMEQAGFALQAIAYVFSAVVGIGLLVGVVWLIGRMVIKTAPAEQVECSASTSTSVPISDLGDMEPDKAPRWNWSSSRFLSKSIAGVAEALEQMLFSEEYATREGLLQRLDARAKIIAIVALLIATSLATRVPTLVALHVLVLGLVVLSEIPLGFFIKRVWPFVPLFAGIVALPALFNVVMPGPDLLVLYNMPIGPQIGPLALPAHLAITSPGLTSFALLIFRVATSVALAALLVMTTKWWTLLKALRTLRVPTMAVLILAMTYRYIYTVLRTIEQTFQARQSRTIGRISGNDNRRWVAASIAALVGKSQQTSNDVYLAMLSRGFSGDFQLAATFAWRQRDVIWLGVIVALGAALLCVERSLL